MHYSQRFPEDFGCEIDPDEASYQAYLRSPRSYLDHYLYVIDPWIIPIERALVIAILLRVLFH